jgi:hypothetical protein
MWWLFIKVGSSAVHALIQSNIFRPAGKGRGVIVIAKKGDLSGELHGN